MPKFFKKDLLSDSGEENTHSTSEEIVPQASPSPSNPYSAEAFTPDSSHASGDMTTMLHAQHFGQSENQPFENPEPHHDGEVVPHEGFANFADLASVELVEGGSSKVKHEETEMEGGHSEDMKVKSMSTEPEADPVDLSHESNDEPNNQDQVNAYNLANGEVSSEEVQQTDENEPSEQEPNEGNTFFSKEKRGHIHNRGLHSGEIGASVPFLNPSHEIESPLDTPELPPAHTAAISSEEPSSEPIQNNVDESYPLPHHDQSPVEPKVHHSAPASEPTMQQDYFSSNAHHYESDPVSTLLTWNAVSRPFRKKNRSFYTTVAIIIILLSLIAVLAGEFMLVGVLFALGFLVYVLNFIPPEEISYKLSTQGVTVGDHFYHWQQLDSFWFTEKDGFKILNILTQIRFPGVLLIVLGDKGEEEVRSVVAKYLPFHEIAPKTMFEKWADSLQKHFPLENPHR